MSRDVEVDALWGANNTRVQEISDLYRRIYGLAIGVILALVGLLSLSIGFMIHLFNH